MPKIAVYAICKNESAFVRRFYDSVKDADYIVVLDTGSEDDTYEEWRRLAETDRKVIVSQKRYDDWRFDAARNDAMDLCPEDTDIYVSVDLDEEFMPGWADELRNNWICGKHTRAEYWYVWSHNPDGSDGRKFRYNKIHDGNWRWKYQVHELLADVRTDSEFYDRDKTLVLSDAVVLHHYPDMNKPRTSYLPLLEKRFAEYHDYYGMFYLGHEYFYRGQYKNCIHMLKAVKSMPQTGATERASCELFIGDSYYALGDIVNAEKSYLCSIVEDRTFFEPYYYLGKMYYAIGKYNDCVGIIEQGLKNRVRHYSWIERDEPWYYSPWDILSIACYRAGRFGESLIYAVKAAAVCPNDERLVNNVKRIIESTEDKSLIVK